GLAPSFVDGRGKCKQTLAIKPANLGEIAARYESDAVLRQRIALGLLNHIPGQPAALAGDNQNRDVAAFLRKLPPRVIEEQMIASNVDRANAQNERFIRANVSRSRRCASDRQARRGMDDVYLRRGDAAAKAEATYFRLRARGARQHNV